MHLQTRAGWCVGISYILLNIAISFEVVMVYALVKCEHYSWAKTIPDCGGLLGCHITHINIGTVLRTSGPDLPSDGYRLAQWAAGGRWPQVGHGNILRTSEDFQCIVTI